MIDGLMGVYYRSPRFLQTIGINAYELNEYWLRKSKEFTNWLKTLRNTEGWKEEKSIEYQNKHLRSIVGYANKYVPFYHRLYKKNNVDISKIKTIDDLEKLPIIKKEDVNKYQNLFFSTKTEKFIMNYTSGTTGKPLAVRISQNLAVLDKANVFRRDLWAGYDGRLTARFVGDSPVKNCNDKTLFRRSYVMKRAIFPTYCLSLEKLPYIFEVLKKLDTRFIQCYPSAGYLLAKFLERNDEHFPLKAILFSSEPMYGFQRELIEERFKTKAFGYYGQAEEIVSALECEKGEYHLTRINGILEIIKDGKKALSGEKGFTVATSLHNYAMPLIRYALNDYTGYKDKRCKCGRTSSLIYSVETKLEDFIITPAGQIISPSILTFPLKHVQNVVESQIIQKTIDKVIIRIVRGENYTSSDELALLNSIKQLLGKEISLKVEYVEKIHYTKNHKKRFVINEMGGDYIEKAFEKVQ